MVNAVLFPIDGADGCGVTLNPVGQEERVATVAEVTPGSTGEATSQESVRLGQEDDDDDSNRDGPDLLSHGEHVRLN